MKNKKLIGVNKFEVINLNNFSKNYYNQITQISVENFGGPSAINSEILEEYRKSPSSIFFTLLDSKNVVGFVGGEIYKKDKIDKVIKSPISRTFPEIERFGFLYIISTKKCYGGLGIGKCLESLFEIEMKKRNVEIIVTPVVLWEKQPQYNVKMFKSLDYDVYKEIPNYYTEESIKDGWTCPECGGVCHHTIAVMYKNLINKKKE